MKTSHSALIVFALIVGSAGTTRADFDYPDFSSVDGLNIDRDAFQNGSVVRLTPSAFNQVGRLYYEERQLVQHGFRTTYDFRISEIAGSGADGIVFLVQNSELADQSITPALIIDIDTYQNPGDPNANHLSVESHVGPTATYFALANLPFNASDGNVHTVNVEYDGLAERLLVTVDNAPSPLIDVSLDISSFMAFDDGMARVGFTSSTGAAPEAHDLHSWSFQSIPEPSTPLLGALAGIGLMLRRRGLGEIAVAKRDAEPGSLPSSTQMGNLG